MTDFKDASRAELKKIQGVCLDIDDTLSTAGKLTAQAYSALWDLKNAGFKVVPITGRPAGWCDHIARFWPVDAVVGENGAFVFYMQNRIRKRLDIPGANPANRARLEKLRVMIEKKFPKTRYASDQAYREFDLAIDVCEDVPAWPRPEVDALLELCKNQGAHAKLSSIHVNTWYGDYDKRTGFEHGSSVFAPEVEKSGWLFIGDSPNDEPMFECFESSVGVANLKRYMDRLKTQPRWLTSRESGEGFAEMASHLIGAHR